VSPAGGGRGKGGSGKGGSGKGRKPQSRAAKKAVEAKRARHAAASVRNADRGGGSRRADRGGPRGRSAPRGLGGDQVEGRQAVRELLLADTRRVRELLVAEEQDDAEVLRDIVELAQDLKVTVREVSRTRLLAEARTESPQGVVARAAELPEHDLDELARRRSPRGAPPFLLAVDGVTDPGNLGALLRSAECAGVTGVVLPKHRAVHVTPTVTKAAAGAIEHLPMALVGGLPSALRQLRDGGVWTIGLDAGGDTDLFDLTVADAPVCLVLGAEGKGLSRLVRERCDAVAGIPLLGHLDSLNVSAAGALACYEITRRRLVGEKGAP
jgi:23S rRNA (guanosine2251-2'-O)-methyltransferase